MGRVRSLKKRRFAEQDSGGDSDSGLAGDNTEEDYVVDPGAIKLLQKTRLRQKGLDSRKALVVPGNVEAHKAALEVEEKEENTVKYSSFQTSFSKEHGITNATADDDMEQYVKEEMAKRLGRPLENTDDKKDAVYPKSIDELALEAAPMADRRDTEPLTAIVAGVDEVPLDFKHKMKNIEDIERAKRALLGTEPLIRSTGDQQHEESRKLRRQFPSKFGTKKKK